MLVALASSLPVAVALAQFLERHWPRSTLALDASAAISRLLLHHPIQRPRRQTPAECPAPSRTKQRRKSCHARSTGRSARRATCLTPRPWSLVCLLLASDPEFDDTDV
eukprot:1882500-Pyramimonas_sp.AAC.1